MAWKNVLVTIILMAVVFSPWAGILHTDQNAEEEQNWFDDPIGPLTNQGSENTESMDVTGSEVTGSELRSNNAGKDQIPVVSGTRSDVFRDEMETTNNWTVSGIPGGWEIGVPTIGPETPVSGDHCWGTNLDGNYPDLFNDTIILQRTIDLRGVSIDYMKVYIWLELESGRRDSAFVEIRSAGQEIWTTLWSNPMTLESEDPYATDGWDTLSITSPMNKFSNSILQLRFRLTSDHATNFSGFYVDRLLIAGKDHPFDAEITEIQSPEVEAIVSPGNTIPISAVVKNVGRFNGSIPVNCFIDEVGGNQQRHDLWTKHTTDLQPLEEEVMEFNWEVPDDPGEYIITFNITWENDTNPENDQLYRTIWVDGDYDIGISMATPGLQVLGPGFDRRITAQIKNSGPMDLLDNVVVEYTAIFLYPDSGDEVMVDQHSHTITLMKRDDRTSYWGWTSERIGDYRIEITCRIDTSADLEDDLSNNSAVIDGVMTRDLIFKDTRAEDTGPEWRNNQTGEWEVWDHARDGFFWTGDNLTGQDSKPGWHTYTASHTTPGCWYAGIPNTERYTGNMHEIIESKPLDISEVPNPTLTFYTKYFVEGAAYDYFELLFSANGTTWERIMFYPETPGGDGMDSSKQEGNVQGWLFKSVPISEEYRTDSFRMRLSFRSDNAINFVGVFIDDIIFYMEDDQLDHPPMGRIHNISPISDHVGKLVTFHGEGYDDGTIQEYIWLSDQDGLLSDKASFQTSSLSVGEHTITLQVRDDNDVLSDPHQWTINIFDPPVAMIDKISPTICRTGGIVSFQGHLEDGKGSITNCDWESDLDGTLSNLSSFSTNTLTEGEHTISFTVQDELGEWSDPVTTTVLVYSSILPVIETEQSGPFVAGGSITLMGSASGPLDVQSYLWTSEDGEVLGSDQTIIVQFTESGSHEVKLKVQDEIGFWTDETNLTITIHQPPEVEIIRLDPVEAFVGDVVILEGRGIDDGSVVTYVWKSDLEGELSNGSEPDLLYTFTEVGSHTITLEVIDNDGAWSTPDIATLVITKVDEPENQKPGVSITTPPPLSTVSGMVSVTGSANDPDGDIEYVQVSFGIGPWINASGKTGWSYTWNTNELPEGDHTIRVRSFDGEVYSSVISVTVTIKHEDTAVTGSGEDSFISAPPISLHVAALLLAGLFVFRARATGSKRP